VGLDELSSTFSSSSLSGPPVWFSFHPSTTDLALTRDFFLCLFEGMRLMTARCPPPFPFMRPFSLSETGLEAMLKPLPHPSTSIVFLKSWPSFFPKLVAVRAFSRGPPPVLLAGKVSCRWLSATPGSPFFFFQQFSPRRCGAGALCIPGSTYHPLFPPSPKFFVRNRSVRILPSHSSTQHLFFNK